MGNIKLEIDLNEKLERKPLSWEGPSKIRITRSRAFGTLRKRGINSKLLTKVDLEGFDNSGGRILAFLPEDLSTENGHYTVAQKAVSFKLWMNEEELLKEWKNADRPAQLVIPFRISVELDGKINKSDNVQHHLSVNFKKNYAERKTEFSAAEEFEKDKIHYSNSKLELGQITFKNLADDYHSYSLSMKQLVFLLCVDNEEFRDVVRVDIDQNTQKEGEDADGFYLNDLLPTRQKKFKLSIDLKKIPLPLTRKTYTVILRGLEEIGKGYFEQIKFEFFSFDMEMDKTETGLCCNRC